MDLNIIDFHTHLDSHWLKRPLIDLDTFMMGLDRCGVRAACIFTLRGFYEDTRPHNDQLAEYARKEPERLIPFATVDPKLGDDAVRELERCFTELKFRGVKFHNWLQAVAPSMVHETMLDILKLAARHEAPLLFHDGTPPYSTTFQIAALARAVPEATVVLGHAGLSDYVYAAGQLIRDIPNLYACFCGPKAGELAYLVECGGSEKILFGSDFGVSDWKLLMERLNEVHHSGLERTDMERVLYGNAERLLDLVERPLKAYSS
jgi:predicted TIM-barrel fold metal-dependent hydrolase